MRRFGNFNVFFKFFRLHYRPCLLICSNTQHSTFAEKAKASIEFPTMCGHSTHHRFINHGYKGVESNTQRCGKPLIPLGSAPGRSLAGTRSLRHKNSSISSGGFQIWAHLPGCTSTVVWPCHTVRGCSRKKALQPTSLYWVSGLHFAS